MREDIWEIAMIIFSSIGVIILMWLLIFVVSKPIKVDCEKYNQPGTGYMPVPKQCEKGDK